MNQAERDVYFEGLRRQDLLSCFTMVRKMYKEAITNPEAYPPHVEQMLVQAFRLLVQRLFTEHLPGSKKVER